MQAYTDPSRENDPHALPDLEVWREKASHTPWDECPARHEEANAHTEECSGWYYWHCFPGCLPDSEPVGPFDSAEEALADAREGLEG